ncbi:flagellar basal body-associated FliL family protein [Salipiger sp. IMCC34102]|uniref:flagellar basal body-associated FliL family protein n=1 Tax=Salipiger sp. IMCC34102 TaxID=2510647 RepID=UPI00101BC806|nr:flagellar basal body-associated FliL family protein [Salipiger sp. IMCC34102]RYH01557.1 flagellar basal body-associated FliL family protein [Salipiger sp. IMCC34102]
MTDVTPDQIKGKAKSSRLGLIVAPVLLIVAAGGSYVGASKFFAPEAAAGQDSHGDDAQAKAHDDASDAHGAGGDVAFVALDPMLVSLADSDRHLRFVAQVEVAPGQQQAVAALTPRLIDTLQDYLRAVGSEHLGDAEALLRLRSQMLRRLQMVAGPDRVRDLLIMEFVLN